MNFALRLYRWLAGAFPHEFKLAFGTDVVQLGEDAVEEIARQHGVAGLIRLVADAAIRVPVEYLSRDAPRHAVCGASGVVKSPGVRASRHHFVGNRNRAKTTMVQLENGQGDLAGTTVSGECQTFGDCLRNLSRITTSSNTGT